MHFEKRVTIYFHVFLWTINIEPTKYSYFCGYYFKKTFGNRKCGSLFLTRNSAVLLFSIWLQRFGLMIRFRCQRVVFRKKTKYVVIASFSELKKKKLTISIAFTRHSLFETLKCAYNFGTENINCNTLFWLFETKSRLQMPRVHISALRLFPQWTLSKCNTDNIYKWK